MKCTSFLLFFLFSIVMVAQNLVPDPSFEQVRRIPTNWSSSSDVFHEYMEAWTSPNGGSPDVFFVGNMGQFKYKRKNVNMTPHAPRSGKYMVGIKTYGCISGTLHCKEYLQIELSEPLETGEEYYAEYWVHPVGTSIRVNNFGLAFQEDAMVGGDGEEAIWIPTEVQDTQIVDTRPNEWVRIAGKFTAGCDCPYLLIGNFLMDEDTKAIERAGDLKYSYYLVDDVIVRPLRAPKTLAAQNIQVGNTLQLNQVYFAHDKATLLPKSQQQLKELVGLFTTHPNLRIAIKGHTDAEGEAAYNLELSQARTEAVAAFLETKGVASERFEAQGLGETQPIADNETPEGRQLNRRVEFVILGL